MGNAAFAEILVVELVLVKSWPGRATMHSTRLAAFQSFLSMLLRNCWVSLGMVWAALCNRSGTMLVAEWKHWPDSVPKTFARVQGL